MIDGELTVDEINDISYITNVHGDPDILTIRAPENMVAGEKITFLASVSLSGIKKIHFYSSSGFEEIEIPDPSVISSVTVTCCAECKIKYFWLHPNDDCVLGILDRVMNS